MRTLMTYRPYGLFNRLDRVFDDSAGGGSHPVVTIREEGAGYVLEAELAGLTESDIEVKVENNILMLSRSGENRKEGENGPVGRFASFHRSFYIPQDVDTGEIEANLVNGLLTVSLPKAEAAKPRQIEVKKA